MQIGTTNKHIAQVLKEKRYRELLVVENLTSGAEGFNLLKKCRFKAVRDCLRLNDSIRLVNASKIDALRRHASKLNTTLPPVSQIT